LVQSGRPPEGRSDLCPEEGPERAAEEAADDGPANGVPNERPPAAPTADVSAPAGGANALAQLEESTAITETTAGSSMVQRLFTMVSLTVKDVQRRHARRPRTSPSTLFYCQKVFLAACLLPGLPAGARAGQTEEGGSHASSKRRPRPRLSEVGRWRRKEIDGPDGP
ncbi:hypothetical protein THAOC_25626, partial [Thalassiosira oceanica]